MTVDVQGKPLLYSISIIRNYIEYLQHAYPDVDIDTVLEHADITRYQLEDPGFFYDQEVADRFHEVVQALTNNPNFARDAGRYTVSSKAYRFIRTYIRGFIGPETAYNLLPKIHSKLSKGATITVRSLDREKLEVVVQPAQGVKEKLYQCENRVGNFEAIAAGFTGSYANVDHPECIHRGDTHCRYILSWNEPVFLRLRRYRNYLLFCTILMCTFMFTEIHHYLTYTEICSIVIALSSLLLGFTIFGWFLEKKDYHQQLADQSRAADLLITETNARYNDARLIQDLGQAVSRILDTDTLLETVAHTLKNRLDYERGIILLANDDKTRLVYKTGYGLSPEQVNYLRQNQLHLDNPNSKGPFVVAFKERKPFLINDVASLSQDLSERGIEILQLSGSRAFLCVPIVFENETLGVLVVDRMSSSIPLQQNDLNLLLGCAPQIAISINNARTFELLQEKEQHYRDLVESANSLILRLDPNGTIKFVNSFPLNFGYSLDDIVGKNMQDFFTVDSADKKGKYLLPYIDRFLKNPESFHSGKTELTLKTGEHIWINWSSKGIRNKKSGELIEILCVGNNITDWMNAEKENRELTEHLIKSQKMEAIGTLAGGVAHDLNNILSGITSYPDLLLMDLPEDAPTRKALLTIKKSGERAAAIVQDLLTLARRGVSVSNPVSLNHVIQEYFEAPEYAKLLSFHSSVEFITRLDPNIKMISGSEVHLMKTLMNLVSNAAEAMPGKVTVSTENVFLDHQTIKGYGRVKQGEYVLLTVSDTGMGIPEADLNKIFEPFFTKKSMGRSGTGLGMTVVWSTVKDLKGYIEVESKEGAGTSFRLYFPVTNITIQKAHMENIEVCKGSENVIVVDDEEYQRDLTKQVLSKLGYHVDVAKSGEDALLLMHDHPADLLILDMIMEPGLDGLETYKKALEISNGQKAIIVSGYTESERVKEALQLGAGAYIKKPYALQDLAWAVRQELDKKSH